MWGLSKHEVRKKLLEQQEELTKHGFDDMVKKCCENVGNKHMHKIVLANRKYLREMLEAADRFEKQGSVEAEELMTDRL